MGAFFADRGNILLKRFPVKPIANQRAKLSNSVDAGFKSNGRKMLPELNNGFIPQGQE